MPAAPRTTYIEIVQTVAQSVGHPKPADVSSSLDEAVLRMGFYANQACEELLTQWDWEQLIKPDTITIQASTPGIAEEAFDLPADFKTFVDDTLWNKSTLLPAIGPVNAQDWQWLKVRQAMITTRFMWRLRGGKFWIKSPPEEPQELPFEYMSKNWAVDGDNATPKAWMTKNADYHIYPPMLPILLTRAKWLKNEGYDSTQALEDFRKAFEFETGSNLGATALSLVPGVGFPYITPERNLPDTGYGPP
jgi:hypothetical protein